MSVVLARLGRKGEDTAFGILEQPGQQAQGPGSHQVRDFLPEDCRGPDIRPSPVRISGYPTHNAVIMSLRMRLGRRAETSVFEVVKYIQDPGYLPF